MNAPDAPRPPLEHTVQRLYDNLREMSGRLLNNRRQVSSMQATEFVHECYLRLARHGEVDELSRNDFMNLAATVLRRLMTDDYRRSHTQRRGGGWSRVTLSAQILREEDETLDLIALDEALERLTEVDPRQAKIVELRFYGGLSDLEIGELMGVSDRTVSRDWTMARAWLRRELTESE